MPGYLEILIVLGVVLLLFGKRLPGVMRSLGSSIVEFKKGINEGEEAEDDDHSHSQKPVAKKEEQA
ncbi:MAG: twin-arginine translocase TatA/TatE family subunit [Planctomyces sp.]|nr:twin-arginine translocase TatA/TatE family subunit [Planctomyces sp.]